MRSGKLLLVISLAASVLVRTEAAAAVTTFTCGMPLTTNLVLAADQSCPGSSGIVVAANGLTINLNGHTISGDRSVGHNGIDNPLGYSGLTVKGGTIERFSVGIQSAPLIVQAMHVTANSATGLYIIGDGSTVTSSLFAANDGIGIYVNGGSTLVKASQVSGNGAFGLYLNGPGSRVVAVQASGNDGTGIVLGANGHVIGAQSSGNAATGIAMLGGARITSSNATGNRGIGILVSGNAAKVGQLPGGPASDRNNADGNGWNYSEGAGIVVQGFVVSQPPVGRNTANGNNDPDECIPDYLC